VHTFFLGLNIKHDLFDFEIKLITFDIKLITLP